MNRRITSSILALVAAISLSGCDQKKETSPVITSERILDLKEKCYNVGKKLVTETLVPAMSSGQSYDEPEYHYSIKLNTCLVYFRTVETAKFSSDTSYHNNKIIDVFANRILLNGNFSRTKDSEKPASFILNYAPNFTSPEFFKRKNQYFSE
jgi:hypothetical protein